MSSSVKKVYDKYTMNERVASRHLKGEGRKPEGPGWKRVPGSSGWSRGSGDTYEYWSPHPGSVSHNHPKHMTPEDHDRHANHHSTRAQMSEIKVNSAGAGRSDAYLDHMRAGHAHHAAHELTPEGMTIKRRDHALMAKHHFERANAHADAMDDSELEATRYRAKGSANSAQTDGANHHQALQHGIAAHLSGKQVSRAADNSDEKQRHLGNLGMDREDEHFHRTRAQSQGHGHKTHAQDMGTIVNSYSAG